MKKLLLIVAALLLLAGGFWLKRKLQITIPAAEPAGELIWADQGWTANQRLQFHHTAQGTRLMPYKWFLVLEKPCASLLDCGQFNDPRYLSRFGFLPSRRDSSLNPDGLPVGFALQRDFHDPDSNSDYPVVGLTCAACHTGAMRYANYTVQVDGAPAMIEVTQFQKALGVSMLLTKFNPLRYARFEKKVLGDNAPAADKDNLKKQFNGFLQRAQAELKATNAQKIYTNEAGFVRTDALTRIGNQVFAVDMQIDKNFAPANAPVRFPQIWTSSWFNWVQYNSSISDPLIRNIGEALGVRAAAKLYGPDATKYENSVDVRGLKKLEDLLAGPAPFQGLRSPKWPGVFPALNQAKIARGADLYHQHCEACHLPVPRKLVEDLRSANPVYWEKNSQGKFFLKVKDVSVDYIGTDPHEAVDFINRKADSGALHQGEISAEKGLDLVTRGIRNNFFTKVGFSPEQQIEWSGYRDPNDAAVRAGSIYKARPLNGIWAVAPYLHNGSVPNLYMLLSPDERLDNFWTGTKRFDPVKVGYETGKIEGGYEFKISQPGNSNKGHEFRDGPKGKGVIGPALPVEDRWALIEFLKSIEEPESSTGPSPARKASIAGYSAPGLL